MIIYFKLRRRQAGSMLLEALIGILIFSFGVLGLVGLQASSMKQSGDAKYRSDASILVENLIGKMWASDRTQLQANFASPSGPGYLAWLGTLGAPEDGSVRQVMSGLNVEQNLPVVQFINTPGSPTQILITIKWNAPYENSATQHSYTVVTNIQ